MNVKIEMLLGWTCLRCGHIGGVGDIYAVHRLSGACKLSPACFVEVPTEKDREPAVRHVMAQFGYSREDAEAIVRLQTTPR